MSSNQTAIRKYRTDDTEALLSIWRQANTLAHPFLENEYVENVARAVREIYLPNAETWVLEKEEDPVGFIALIEDEIGGLFLSPSLHGKGLGRAMVDHAVALHGPLRVEVFRKNALGRRFYESYGFAFVEEYRHEASGEMTYRLAMPSS